MLILHVNLPAADLNQIGVVDFSQIIDRSVAGKAIQKKIQKKGEQLKSELESAQAGIKELQEKYKQEAPLWTKEKRAEKEDVFKKKINDYNLLKIKNEKEFNEFKAKLINDVKADLIAFARKKAEKEGYLLIIEKQTGSIIYSRPSINITEELVKDLDRRPAAK